jgi:hypothetical protein
VSIQERGQQGGQPQGSVGRAQSCKVGLALQSRQERPTEQQSHPQPPAPPTATWLASLVRPFPVNKTKKSASGVVHGRWLRWRSSLPAPCVSVSAPVFFFLSVSLALPVCLCLYLLVFGSLCPLLGLSLSLVLRLCLCLRLRLEWFLGLASGAACYPFMPLAVGWLPL